MASVTHDLYHEIKEVQDIVPAVYKTNQAQSSGIDTAGYESCVLVFETGAYTDGTHTPAAYECDTINGTYTAVAASSLLGAFTAVSSSAGQNKIQKVGYVGSKRFVEVQVTSSGTTGMVYGTRAILGNPHNHPV